MVMIQSVGRGLVPRRRVCSRITAGRIISGPSSTATAGTATPGAVQARALQKRVALLVIILLAMSLTGCQPAQTRLTIRGGPSLDALFSDLASAYQQQNPHVMIVSDFTCPPCVLFKRPGVIKDFDLFASLGQFELDRLQQGGQISFARTASIGTTRLAVATSTRAKTSIKSIADLRKPGLRRIGMGDPGEVGVGFYAKEALVKADLWDTVESHAVYSQSGCELLKWLGLGRDIEAAIVFTVCSDEDRSSIGQMIEFPAELIAPVPLLLATPKDSPRAAEAQAFIAFCRSEAARPILVKHKVAPIAEVTAGGGRPSPQGWKPCSTRDSLAAGSRSYRAGRGAGRVGPGSPTYAGMGNGVGA
ncbi:MAG: molybdate ABC transporter substrate-binding protein [Armatimonadota bacterium]